MTRFIDEEGGEQFKIKLQPLQLPSSALRNGGSTNLGNVNTERHEAGMGKTEPLFLRGIYTTGTCLGTSLMAFNLITSLFVVSFKFSLLLDTLVGGKVERAESRKTLNSPS